MSRWQVPEHFKVLVGGNTYVDCPTIISYKGDSLFELRRSASDGFLAINFDLYDSGHTKIATVRNGQFVGKTPPGFRVQESLDQFAVLEESTNRCVCEVKLRSKAAGDAELEVAASMYMPDGRLLKFSPTETWVPGAVFRGCTFTACSAAIVIE